MIRTRVTDEKNHWISPKKRPVEFAEAVEKRHTIIDNGSRALDRRRLHAGNKSQGKHPYRVGYVPTSSNHKPTYDPSEPNRVRVHNQRIRSGRYNAKDSVAAVSR